MMATAPTVNQPTDVSTAFSSEAQVASDFQNSGPNLLTGIPDTNGNPLDAKRNYTVEDSQPLSADVSVSGGSDSEAARLDGAGQKDGGHARTASAAKKPATFKAVSVNKTFLGTKTTSNSPLLKATDRPATSSTPPAGASALSTSRPRLVVKSGTGQKDGTSRISSANGGKPAAAPSPSAVWNKNRAPEPKKFTDEELKKDYGIHMASRLNEENNTSGQNKWADIADDDDDWIPDIITWGDGTKTTLPHPEEGPESAPDFASAVPSEVIQEPPTEKTVPNAPPRVLTNQKPAAAASPLKGLILKANHNNPVPEKSILVAKPSQLQQPAKSPWAMLPPVEKVSPAAPPSNPAQASMTGNKDFNYGRAVNVGSRNSQPDEAHRSLWRDTSQRREAFNHQPGRYEHLADRRGSQTSMRPPAVLQRPQPPAGNQPVEPSSAFQSARTSHDPPLRRRRGSSNVSGESGSLVKKGSDGPVNAQEPSATSRRPSVVGSTETPSSPTNAAAQPYQQPRKQAQQQGWGSRISPNTSSAVPSPTSQPAPNVGPLASIHGTRTDEVEYQKKLMRERKEMAQKRHGEEAAQEAAAKEARIQKNLRAMGPLPENRGANKQTSPRNEPVRPIQIQQRRQPGSASEPSTSEAQDRVQSTRSSSKPDNQKEQQHHYATTPSGQGSRRSSHGQGPDSRRPNIWPGQGPAAERMPPWTAPRTQHPPSRNVWGSPDDRALGNGTFNPDLGRAPGAPSPASAGPAPIAPPTGGRGPSQRQQAQSQAPIGPRQPPRYPTTDLANQWTSSVAESDRQINAENVQRRVDLEKRLAEPGATLNDTQPVIKDTWRQVQLPGDGTRHITVPAEAPASVNPWKKDSREDLATEDTSKGSSLLSTNAGTIGPESGGLMNSPAPGMLPQWRASRFFPNPENRSDIMVADNGRSGSPIPPPPTMEGHPAYEGDASRPHVSLPKPHPVVKLPPTIRTELEDAATHTFGWAKQQPFKKVIQDRPDWQAKIHSLLNGNKPSLSSSSKIAGIDPASKSALEIYPFIDLATISLPSSVSLVAMMEPITKPMAEECFEEQEVGSLPHVQLPKETPEAAWQLIRASIKPLPHKFFVQPNVVESYIFDAKVVGGSKCLKIQLPGMIEAKNVSLPLTMKVDREGHGRGGPRHRGSGRSKRDASDARVASPPNSVASSRGRGGYRGQGSSWKGQSATPSVGQSS